MAEPSSPTPERVGRRRYNFLGLRVNFASDRPETLTLLDAIYGHFRNGSDGSPNKLEEPEELDFALTCLPGEEPAAVLDVMGQKHPLARPPLTDVHAYSILLGELFQRLGDYFLVHGACVTDGERTLLITGPSGQGKTTLSLRLLERGFRILSDDLTPIGRHDGLVRPFPKRVGVKRDSGDPHVLEDERLADTLKRTRPVALGDKWLLDPAELQGDLETQPRRLTHLLVLEPKESPTRGAHRFRVALVHGQEDFRTRINEMPGVRARSIVTRSGRSALDVEVAADPPSLSAFYEACSATRHQIIHFQPGSDVNRFDAPPSITPCDTVSAAMATMREVLNRESSGALVSSVGGGLSPLLMELAAGLQGVHCARLRVGDRAATAGLVAKWIGSGP